MKHFNMELNPEMGVMICLRKNKVAIVGMTLAICFILVLIGAIVGIAKTHAGDT